MTSICQFCQFVKMSPPSKESRASPGTSQVTPGWPATSRKPRVAPNRSPNFPMSLFPYSSRWIDVPRCQVWSLALHLDFLPKIFITHQDKMFVHIFENISWWSWVDLGEGHNLQFEGFRRIIGIPTLETKIFRKLASLANFVSKVLKDYRNPNFRKDVCTKVFIFF